VGDVRFQKKCLNKMQDVSQDGRTVLFVSHSMPAITRLCQRAVLLDQGRVAAEGPVHQVVASYLNSHLGSSAERTWDELSAPSGASTRLRAVRVRTEQGHVSEAIDIRQPFQVEMEFEVTRGDALILPHVHFFNEEDVHLFCSLDSDPAWRRRPRPPGRYVSRAWVPGNLLAEGTIFLHFNMVSLKDNVEEFSAPNAITIQVIDNLDGDSARVDWPAALPGVMRPLLRWTTEYLPGESLEAEL
jgi:lipopolysaccharide transport system ATP-binding protein